MKGKKPKWLDGALALEQQAVEAMYAELSPELYRYAFRLIGTPQDAEDLVAEAFIRLLRTLQREKADVQHIRAYLYRVVHNLAVDSFRKGKWIQPEVDVSELEQAENTEELEQDILAAGHVRKALWKLTDQQRQVLLLRYVQELSFEEIGAVLKKPPGAVKALRHRGLEALRRVFQQQEEESRS